MFDTIKPLLKDSTHTKQLTQKVGLLICILPLNSLFILSQTLKTKLFACILVMLASYGHLYGYTPTNALHTPVGIHIGTATNPNSLGLGNIKNSLTPTNPNTVLSVQSHKHLYERFLFENEQEEEEEEEEELSSLKKHLSPNNSKYSIFKTKLFACFLIFNSNSYFSYPLFSHKLSHIYLMFQVFKI